MRLIAAYVGKYLRIQGGTGSCRVRVVVYPLSCRSCLRPDISFGSRRITQATVASGRMVMRSHLVLIKSHGSDSTLFAEAALF